MFIFMMFSYDKLLGERVSIGFIILDVFIYNIYE